MKKENKKNNRMAYDKKYQKSDDIYDLSEQFVDVYGKPESESYKKHMDEVWAEYNASVLLSARKESGLTQKEVAEKLGVDKAYVSKIEKGQVNPSASLFVRFVNAIGKDFNIV